MLTGASQRTASPAAPLTALPAPAPAVLETYHLLSQRWFTHASPTLFNAGTPRPQLSSCFLICMKNDSIEGAWAGTGRPGRWRWLLASCPACAPTCTTFNPTLRAPFPPGIYDTLKECACISKSAGGIGLSMHNIRATGSYIRGTNGTSNGIVPMLRVFNDTGARQAQLPAPALCAAALPAHHRIAHGCHRCTPAPPPAPPCRSTLRGPGRRQAQGRVCHVLRALARRHL